MAKLTSEQQLFIVDRLAMWRTPTEVANEFKDEFDVVIGRDQVAKYDPLGRGGQNMAKKLKERHTETRQRFREDIDAIPIANRAYRIQRLHDMHLAALKAGNRQQAAALLEQAAKETGGSFTNAVTVRHKGMPKPAEPLTIDKLRSALTDAIGLGFAERMAAEERDAKEKAKRAS